MVEIFGKLINKSNIACVNYVITNSDGYTYKKTYHINIKFIGDYTMQLKTYDEEEFKKWWEMLK